MAARDYSKFVSPLPHPGEHLREDYLSDYGLTAGSLAKAMGLRDRTRIERLVREAQPVTPDTRFAACQSVRNHCRFLDEPSGAARSFRSRH